MNKKREEYLQNKEKYLARARRRYDRSLQNSTERLKRMVIEAKARAKARGVVFDIAHGDIIWNTHCPVLGLELVLNNPGHGGAHNSPSIDRIDNSLGYVKGNVRIISNRANKLKNNMSKEECELLLKNWDKISLEQAENYEQGGTGAGVELAF